MLKRFIGLLFVITMLSSTTGCANHATAKLTPGSDLGKLKNFYIVQSPEDLDTSGLIKTNLEKRGFTATTGSENKPSDKHDAVVTYVSKWMWDITMYMLELTINVRDPASDFPMAVGNSLHASLTRKSAEAMVDEVLTNIFGAK